MENCQTNRKVVNNIGDLVELLYDELRVLPLSEEAKNAMVTIMLCDVLKREGWTVSFQCPPEMVQKMAAA
jgi:hypothetical protein